MATIQKFARQEMFMYACEIDYELLQENIDIPCCERAIILKPFINKDTVGFGGIFLDFGDDGRILFTFDEQWDSDKDREMFIKTDTTNFKLHFLMDSTTANRPNVEKILPFVEQVVKLYFQPAVAEYVHICYEFGDTDTMFRHDSIENTRFYNYFLFETTLKYAELKKTI